MVLLLIMSCILFQMSRRRNVPVKLQCCTREIVSALFSSGVTCSSSEDREEDRRGGFIVFHKVYHLSHMVPVSKVGLLVALQLRRSCGGSPLRIEW